LKNEKGSRALAEVHNLPSFNSTVDKKLVSLCFIAERTAVYRDRAELFACTHRNDGPTFATADDWQKHLEDLTYLNYSQDIEQGKPVQDYDLVTRANDPPITTRDQLKELGTDVEELQEALDGVMFVVCPRLSMLISTDDTYRGHPAPPMPKLGLNIGISIMVEYELVNGMWCMSKMYAIASHTQIIDASNEEEGSSLPYVDQTVRLLLERRVSRSVTYVADLVA
jgi:hypothetical protein